MRWASYREDIQSRLFGACRQRPTIAPKPRTAGAEPSPARKPRPATSTKRTEMKKPRTSPSPLPVILLADISGTMAADGKIDALNTAVADILAAFAEEDWALADPKTRVFEAREARQIKQFFLWVTMRVRIRSRGVNPNHSVMISPDEVDDSDEF
jgi:hypothetical protein